MSVVGQASTGVGTDKRAPSEAEFRRAFLMHWESTYRAAYRVLGDAAESEDVAQEAFVQLLRRPLAAGREHNLAGWLHTVATNLSLNVVRGQARRSNRERQAAPTESGGEDALASVSVEEEREAVRAVLAELSARQRDCLLLRHAGLPYAAIGATIGVAPSSVGTILARAEREFKRLYLERKGGY